MAKAIKVSSNEFNRFTEKERTDFFINIVDAVVKTKFKYGSYVEDLKQEGLLKLLMMYRDGLDLEESNNIFNYFYSAVHNTLSNKSYLLPNIVSHWTKRVDISYLSEMTSYDNGDNVIIYVPNNA